MNIIFNSLAESDDIAAYQEMTFPRFRQLLEDFSNYTDLIVIRATDADNTPAGMGLAFHAPGTEKAEIGSVYILHEFRRKGVGTALWEYLEKTLHDRQCRSAEVYYDSEMASTPALERILAKLDWNTPQIFRMFYKADIREMMKAPWNNYRLPEEFAVFPWTELTEAEREEILRRQEAEEWYPEILSPFRDEEFTEPVVSVGVRYRGEVAGWMICHRVSENTVRYSKLFVRKDLQRMGRAIPLLAESLRRHDASSGENIPQYALWQVEYDNVFMMNFVKRRVMPHICEIHEYRRSFKEISSTR
jgi:GNAT superfamily N-acetyltransferase